MIQVSVSGVCVQEKSNGLLKITWLATSTTAFNDGFTRGVRDGVVQPVHAHRRVQRIEAAVGRPGAKVPTEAATRVLKRGSK